MRRWWLPLLAMLAFCTEQNRIVVHDSNIDDRTKPDVGENFDLLHVPVTTYTAQKPGFYAVHDSSDWLFIWKDPRHDAQPPPAPREIDFRKEMLFVATAATEGAKAIKVTKVIGQSSGIHVYVTETLGGPGCPVEPGPPAMDIVAFKSSAFDIHVHHDRIHADECGPPPDAVALCRTAGAGLPGNPKITATAGQTVDCDASGSRARTGSIVDRGWQLTNLPPGSATKLTVGAQSLGVTLVIDAWGTYDLSLLVRDDARSASTTATIEAPPPDVGVPIELHWTSFTRMDDASIFPHVELHVVDVANPASDCNAAVAKPWCDVHVTGTVQQAVLRPEAGKTYRAFVSYQDFRLKGSPVACVRMFPKDKPSVVLCDESLRAAGAVWEAGTIDEATRTLYDPKKGKPSADAGVPAAKPDAGAVEHKNPF